jgi:predicted GNAT superfamily acetyltransferase
MMAPVVRRKKRKDEIKITVAPFRNLADYKACEDIQREVWHAQDTDIVPTPLLMIAHRTGGILLGAYNSLGDMIGFVFSIMARLDGMPIQHSYALAVRPSYRNFDVGFKLKMAQRKEALRRKISVISSAFDPTQPLQAYFALGKLCQRGVGYEENFCGDPTSAPGRGLPTDRILTHWNLDDSSVVRRLETGPPRRDLRKELKQHVVINHLSELSPGLFDSSPMKLNCMEDHFLFEVPHNLLEIRNKDLGLALGWQVKMRQVFRNYFRKRYMAVDFWVADQDGRPRSFYVLEKKKTGSKRKTNRHGK